MNKKLNKYVFIIISKDFNSVVTRGFKSMPKNPFFGIDVKPFEYKVDDEILTFSDEDRAENALKHFYFKQLAEKENTEFRPYCIIVKGN